MLLAFIFLKIIFCKSNYQDIIDLTKKSAKKFTLLSDDYIKNENNQIKMPGNYHENDVSYSVSSPIFATDSIIVKGFSMKDNIFGLIPTNNTKFKEIINSFNILDRKTQSIYKAKNLLDESDGVYIFLAEKEEFTSVFDITYVNMTCKKYEIAFDDIGIKIVYEINSEKSTKTNVISLTIGFCYDLDRDDEYSLKNIYHFNWPKIDSLGKWNNVLKFLMAGCKINYEIRKTGFLRGTFEFSIKEIKGCGISCELGSFLEEILSPKRWDHISYPYIPFKSIKFYGIDLGLECGCKFSTFLEEIQLNLLKVGVLIGTYADITFAFNYDFLSLRVFKNFRIIRSMPQCLTYVPTIPKIIEDLYITCTIKPAVVPFYFKLDMPGVKIDVDFRFDLPFIFTINGNSNCTANIDFELDFGLKLVFDIDIHIPFRHNISRTETLNIISEKKLFKKCITDYTDEYKAGQLKNEQEHDKFEIVDPDKPDETPFQYFQFSASNITGKNYTAIFTKPFEDGKLEVLIDILDVRDCNRLIFSITNGYVLPEYATKLDGENIYLIKTNALHLTINFKRYKDNNVIFHFYSVYAMYNDNGSYMCPTAFPVDKLSYFTDIGCIGVESTPSMMQCCNDCNNNFCYDPIPRKKISNKYYILTSSPDLFFQVGEPYWVPEYHTFPDNIESFVIPANEYVYVPRVKCDRCDSVQFIVNGTAYPSKYWGKTKLFSPKIPINGYDYDPDPNDFSFDTKLNTLKGISNHDITAIAICNNNDKSYCYSKCIEPKGYSVIEMNDENGMNVYSGDPSKEVPENIYEMNSQYQVINYDDVPKNSYCSKSWEGQINVQTLTKNKITLSIVDKTDEIKKIKAYYGSTYIPFSRTKYFSNIKIFLQNIGVSILDNKVVLSDSNESTEVFYATLNSDGSVDVNSKYFNENNIKISEDNINIESSYIKSIDIIHSEFIPIETKDSKNKIKIIIVCCVIGTIILLILTIIIVIIFIKKRKQKTNDKTETESSLNKPIL